MSFFVPVFQKCQNIHAKTCGTNTYGCCLNLKRRMLCNITIYFKLTCICENGSSCVHVEIVLSSILCLRYVLLIWNVHFLLFYVDKPMNDVDFDLTVSLRSKNRLINILDYNLFILCLSILSILTVQFTKSYLSKGTGRHNCQWKQNNWKEPLRLMYCK